MKTASDPFEDAALVYIRLVERISREAAADIEQIRAEFGSHAALRAALIIMILKMEVQQNQWVPHFSLYTHLIGDYPEALPLAKRAMQRCLDTWMVASEPDDIWVALPACDD
jgi:hypothetical protein